MDPKKLKNEQEREKLVFSSIIAKLLDGEKTCFTFGKKFLGENQPLGDSINVQSDTTNF